MLMAIKENRREAEDKTETTETVLSELDKEKKCHRETKKSLAALEKEYNSCREELKVVQEEKERYKTRSKDLESIINLSNPSEVLESTNKSSNELAVCEECEYPCRTKTDLSIHQQSIN